VPKPKPARKYTRKLDTIILSPERAAELLEHNSYNRPLSQPHVERIARQIRDGKWKFNGDTIKISTNGDVLDGQHRLWAVLEAKKAIETVIVYGIERDAFATIDTIRKHRSMGDTVALNGQIRYRTIIAAALMWLIRWQKDTIETYRAPQNRIENSMIEEAYAVHGEGLLRAAERTRLLRQLANHGLLAFVYYVVANREPELADRMMNTLEDPAGVSTTDPFFKLRSYFTLDHHKKKDPVAVIALCFKALNAAHRDEKIGALTWKNQGSRREEFPLLMLDKGRIK